MFVRSIARNLAEGVREVTKEEMGFVSGANDPVIEPGGNINCGGERVTGRFRNPNLPPTDHPEATGTTISVPGWSGYTVSCDGE